MNLFKRAAELGLKITGLLAFLAPLITRLVVGMAFFLDGRGKWMNLDKVIEFFTGLGIPFPAANATFISLLELVGGLLLVAGLGTRLFSFLLAGTMAVALMTADKEGFLKIFGDATAFTDVAAFVNLLFLGWLVLYGPGIVSLDALVGKKLGLGKHAGDDNLATGAEPSFSRR